MYGLKKQKEAARTKREALSLGLGPKGIGSGSRAKRGRRQRGSRAGLWRIGWSSGLRLNKASLNVLKILPKVAGSGEIVLISDGKALTKEQQVEGQLPTN